VRVTRIAFLVGDVVAWVACILLCLLAFASVVYAPLSCALFNCEVSWPKTVFDAAILLLGAGGCYRFTRRRPWALLLALVPAADQFLDGWWEVGASFGLMVLLLLGTPYLLVVLEVHRLARSEP
jgi:hypothetical protein